MMAPLVWIFFALLWVAGVQDSQAIDAACNASAWEYVGSNKKLFDDIRNVSRVLQVTLDPAHANETQNFSTDAAFLCPGKQFSLFAQAAENLMKDCSNTPEICPDENHASMEKPAQVVPDVLLASQRLCEKVDFSPNAFRAAAQFCDNVDAADYLRHFRALAPCWEPLYDNKRRSFAYAAISMGEELWASEYMSAARNFTVGCSFPCGRKCACRKVQVGVPLLLLGLNAAVPDVQVREMCSVKMHDLAMDLQGKALNALDCSEFGDYVRDWGWLKVDFQANKTARVPYR